MIPEGNPVCNRQTTVATCIAPPLQVAKYTWPGSNWRPSACEADVIATRPQVLRNSEGAWWRRKCACKPFGMDPPKTRTWNPQPRLRHCGSVCHWDWLQVLIAINCKVAHACVLWLPPFSIWPCGLMDKALVLGTKDCRFESCQGQFISQ